MNTVTINQKGYIFGAIRRDKFEQQYPQYSKDMINAMELVWDTNPEVRELAASRGFTPRVIKIISWAAQRVIYEVDTEALAEGGIGDFLEEIEPFLATEGIYIDYADLFFDPEYVEKHGYWVEVNGAKYEIYVSEDIRDDLEAITTGSLLEMLNDMLYHLHSDKRAWFIQDHIIFAPTLDEAKDILEHIQESNN